MAAGFMPTPSSKEFQGLTNKIPEFSMEDITGPEQPALLAGLNDLVQDLPELGQQIEDRLIRARAERESDLPELPDVSQGTFVAGFQIGEEVQNAEVAKVAGTVNFDLDGVDLDAAAKAQLDELAAWLTNNPNAVIGIFGHTDLTGPEEYNDALGQNRAERVALYLQTLGVSADRIGIVMSFGETAPMVRTQEKSRENRRVKVQTIRKL